MSPRHAPISFGKYQLVERIGRGGMAEVWKASMVGPGGFTKTLVVKRILPELVRDKHFVAMFLAEASLCARLNHANIVPVYELGDVDGEYFLAMEYVVGHDLVSVLRALQSWPTPPGLGAYVVREVCRALAYAHALTDKNGAPLRLVHRDVTPSNVMLAIDGHVRLLDFGIAKMLADVARPKTDTGTLKGKFGYMSPEQVEGLPIDHRSDLFSVGVLLHELLTGRRLFRGDHDLQTLALVRHATVPPPSALNGEVPLALDEVCLRALQRRPEDRYKDCAEMAAALDPIVRDLHWGAEQLSALLAELLPTPRTGSDSARVARDDTDSSPSPSPTPRRRRWLVPAILIPVAGVALALGARNRLLHTTPAPTPIVVAPAAAAPELVSVTIDSTPPGADVTLDDETQPRGRTPFVLKLPRGDARHKLTFVASGRPPSSREIGARTDSELQIAFEPPTPQSDALAKPKTKHARPKHEDLADPFHPNP